MRKLEISKRPHDNKFVLWEWLPVQNWNEKGKKAYYYAWQPIKISNDIKLLQDIVRKTEKANIYLAASR
jgi:hypothetical protein